MRVALHSTLRSGAIDGYRTAHLRIPDDLVAAFDRVGIHEWTIWRSGDRLFHLVLCDDFDAAMRALEHDPANRVLADLLVSNYERKIDLLRRATELAPRT